MSKTLEVLHTRLAEKRYLLSGWSVYVCGGVAGNSAPSKIEMQMIVEAAGGTWVKKLDVKSNASIKGTLIITSDPEPRKQTSSKSVKEALALGAQKRTTKWLFRATFTQTTDLPF